MKQYHKVTFLPENKTIEVAHLKTIFETILENNPQNIELHFACGSEGICQKCKIRAFQKMGPYTPTEKGCLSEEEIKKGIRLACQARVIQNMEAEIIFKMPFSIDLMNEPISSKTNLEPRVCKHYMQTDNSIRMTKEWFVEYVRQYNLNGADTKKLLDDIKLKDRKISAFFEKNISDCTAVYNHSEIICLETGNTTTINYAVAVDLGTNTLMLSLLDLTAGEKIAVVTDTNPQIEMGSDIESRINMVADNPVNLEILSEEILLRIDILILELCRAANVSALHVYEIVVTGTTGMLHLFIKGIPELAGQQNLLNKGKKVAFLARQAEIRSSSRATIYTLPVISSYIGADITAGILATQLHRSSETMLFLDIGTVVKAVLHHNGKILAASIPGAGTFECTETAFGMRPESGAIEGVKIDNDINLSIIGKSLPRGICGSGFMELTAELLRTGIINSSGVFQDESLPDNLNPEILNKIITVNNEKSFLLYSDNTEFKTDIYVTQKDIYLLRQSKASVVSMIKNLIDQMHITCNDIARILIGGAFGHRIDTKVFAALGMIPAFLSENVSFTGNTSKKGAQIALLDKNILDEAEALVQNIVSLPPLTTKIMEDDLHFHQWH